MPQVEWEFNKLKIKVQEEDELNNNKQETKKFKLLAFFGVLHLHSYLLNSCSLDHIGVLTHLSFWNAIREEFGWQRNATVEIDNDDVDDEENWIEIK